MYEQATVTQGDEERDPGRLWMLELREGDPDALRRIVLHYGRSVVSFLCRFGADRAMAEDLSQEVFLRVWRARHRYQPTARFSTWLYRITHRIAINEGKRNRWRHAVSIQGPAGSRPQAPSLPEPSVDPAHDPLHLVSLGEVRQQVRDAVLGLPENQRTALLLNRFEGMSCEQVGAVLGLKVPAVKSLLFRARDNVRKALAPLLREEVTDDEPR